MVEVLSFTGGRDGRMDHQHVTECGGCDPPPGLLLFGLGMILDAISISYLIMPVLIPVLAACQIDPVWYGVIFVCALAIGHAAAPVGVNLFTVANLPETNWL